MQSHLQWLKSRIIVTSELEKLLLNSKNSPEEYADELIGKYSDIINPNSLYVTTPVVRCAIIDVTNTLDSVEKYHKRMYQNNTFKKGTTFKYYSEVLTILKSKL